MLNSTNDINTKFWGFEERTFFSKTLNQRWPNKTEKKLRESYSEEADLDSNRVVSEYISTPMYLVKGADATRSVHPVCHWRSPPVNCF
jgi:hypothetical protein